MKRRFLCVLVLPLLLVGKSSAQELSRSELYYRTLRSTAWMFGPNLQGTGWVIDRERRLVLTNRHISQDAEKIAAVFPIFQDGRAISDRSAYKVKEMRIVGTVIHREPKRDLAIVQLERLPDGVPQLELAATSAPAGSDVHIVGNEALAGCLWTYTPGKVSRVAHMKQNVGGFVVDAKVAHVAAAFTHGDSGGPVVNDKGQAVAIYSATSYTGGSRNYSGFCIDVTEIKAFLAETITRLKEPDVKDVPAEKVAAKSPTLPKTADGPTLPFAELSSRTLKASAWVRTANSSAAGWLADDDKKLLVTSASAVTDAAQVDVFFAQFKDDKPIRDRSAYQGDVKPIRGKVVQRDAATDLAVVELESLPADVPALKLAPATPLVGESLYFVTNPKAGKSLFQERSGLVRNTYRRKNAKSELDTRVVLLGLSLSDGESGAPVVNKSGELVAVTSTRATNAPMLGCCIDVNEVRAILAKAIQK